MTGCISDLSIVQQGTGDGSFPVVDSTTCVLVSGAVVTYTQLRHVVAGVSTVVWVDSDGVETPTLPLDAEIIPCDKVVYVASTTVADQVTVSPVVMCDAGVSFIRHITYVNGVPDAVVDTEADGITAYTASGAETVGECKQECGPSVAQGLLTSW